MSIQQPLKYVLATSSLLCLTLAVPVQSQDTSQDRNLRMIAKIDVNPAHSEDWNKAWMDIVSMAPSNGYSHTEMVYSSGPTRWIVTPLSNYAGIDEVQASRRALREKVGSRFERAVGALDDAELNAQTYFLRHDPDLSYNVETDPEAVYYRVDTYAYRPGHQDELKDIAKEYKAFLEKVGNPYSYNVFWTTIGAPQPGMVVMTTADSHLALAQEEADDEDFMKPHESAMEDMFEDFGKAVLSSTREYATYKPDMSFNVPE